MHQRTLYMTKDSPTDIAITMGRQAIESGVINDRVFISGFSDTINSTTETAIWTDGGTDFTFPANSSPLVLRSADSRDNGSGTGGRTVRITGLNSDYEEVVETVTLTGTANTVTSTSFLRMNSARLASAGTNKKLFGNVSIKHQSSDMNMGTIRAVNGRTLQTIYTVPANTYFLITETIYEVAKAQDCVFKAYYAGPGAPLTCEYISSIYEMSKITSYRIPIPISPKTDIVVKAITSAGTASGSCSISGITYTP